MPFYSVNLGLIYVFKRVEFFMRTFLFINVQYAILAWVVIFIIAKDMEKENTQKLKRKRASDPLFSKYKKQQHSHKLI